MDVYIGLDVSLASTAVCVLDEKGKIATEAQVASTPEALVSFMAKLEHEIAAVGLEAGPLVPLVAQGDDRRRLRACADGDPADEGCAEGDADQDGSP